MSYTDSYVLGLKKIILMIVIFLYIPLSFADNPCGVQCTKDIATKSAGSSGANILALAKAYTDLVAAATLNSANAYTDTQIDTRVYEKIIIYAENNGSVDNDADADDWAYGSSDTGAIGVPVVDSWELYGFSFQAKTVNSAQTVTIEVFDPEGSAFTPTAFTCSITPSTKSCTSKITSVAIPAGATIGFRTTAPSADNQVIDARATAWLRRHPD